MKKKAILIVAVLLAAFLVMAPAVSADYQPPTGVYLGYIEIHVSPANSSTTYIDNISDSGKIGWYHGIQTIQASSGTHIIYSVFTDGTTYSEKVYVNPSETSTVLITKEETTTGSIHVTSSPSNATVSVNGNYDSTPCTFSNLNPGSYSVTVSKNGYSTQTKYVTVYSNSTTDAHFTLNSETTYGYIAVNSTPNYANVYIDGVFKGQTPITVTVPTGSHSLEVTKSGYTGFTTSTYVYEGRTNTFMATLSQNVTYAYILVGSNPTGATVYLDGSEIGTTPNSGSLSHTVTANTTHSLTIKASGYDTYSTSFNLVTNETKSFYPTLTKSQPQAGYVNISSVPSGASVYIDTVYAGSTPLYQAVDAGTHNIKLSCLGYNDYTTTVTVIAGQTAPVQATMTATSTPSTKSPVPVLGILIGLGAAAIFAGRKLRR